MKKALSIILSLTMILGISAIVPLTARAAGNSYADADPYTVGQTVDGALSDDNTADCYTFTLASSGSVNLDFLADKMFSYEFADAAGTAVLSGCANLVNRNVDLISGKYYFTVKRTVLNPQNGAYRFTLTFTSANESFKESADTNNNSLSKANAIALSKSYTGQLAANDDVDYYAFSVSSTTKVTVSSSADVSLTYNVYNSSGSSIYMTVSEILQHDLTLAAGKYYFAAKKTVLNPQTGIFKFSVKPVGNVKSIVLDQSSMTLYRGSIGTLTATVTPANAAHQTVTWSSSRPSVAYAFSGKVIAISPGTARVTAKTENGKTAVCTVKVVLYAPAVKKLESTTSGVKLSWDAVGGAEKYRVFYNDGTAWVKLGDTDSTGFIHKAVKTCKKYTYTVRCISKDGTEYTSDFNHQGWAITYVAAPKPPTLKNTVNGVQVSWKRTAGAAKYRLYRKAGGGSWQAIADTKSLTYLDKTAKSGVTYRYTLRCLNKNGKVVSGFYSGTAIKCKR